MTCGYVNPGYILIFCYYLLLAISWREQSTDTWGHLLNWELLKVWETQDEHGIYFGISCLFECIKLIQDVSNVYVSQGL